MKQLTTAPRDLYGIFGGDGKDERVPVVALGVRGERVVGLWATEDGFDVFEDMSNFKGYTFGSQA